MSIHPIARALSLVAVFAGGEEHATSWTATAGMIDLGTLGGTFSSVADLNHMGQNVGISSIAGDAAYHAMLWQSITPSRAIADLAKMIRSFNLHHGIQASLISKLHDARFAIMGQDTPLACGDLAALIDEANAQAGKHLTIAQANAIRDAAAQIRSQLGC